MYDTTANITIDSSAVTSRNYSVIANSIFKDSTLSLKAIGLLCCLLSRDESTWNFSLEGETKLHDKDGKDSIRSAVHELEERGYIIREQHRDAKGRISSMTWHIFDVPQEPKKEVKKEVEEGQMTLSDITTEQDVKQVGQGLSFTPASESKMHQIIDDLMRETAEANRRGTRAGWGSKEEKENFDQSVRGEI